MAKKPTYEELEQRVKDLEKQVSGHERAEEALQASEEKFRALSEAAFETIFLSEKGVCLGQNLTAEKMFGYTPSEVIGRPGTDWIAPESREMVMNNMLSGYERPYEAIALRKDGSTFPVEIQGKMICYQDREIRVTSLCDITNRVLDEKALRESEERYRTLMDNLPVAVYRNTPGPAGEFLMANPAFCKMFGFKNEEEVKDFTPASLYPNPKERKEYSDYLIQKGVIKNDERRLLKRDGTPIHTSITSRLVYGKNGEVSHFDSIMLDITDRVEAQKALQKAHDELEMRVEERTAALSKANEVLSVEIAERTKAEEALQESEEKYRSILENIEEAYYEADIAGRFTFFNDSLSKITGYSADELMGSNIRGYTDQNRAMEGEKAFKDVSTTGKPVKGFAWEITRKDGNKRHAEVSASLIRGGGGKGIGFLGIIRDVSERKQAEQQIKASLKEKETLLKETHYRVNNNMQVIISLLRLQSVKIKDKKYAGMFKDSENRIKSMALIHETLYRSKDFASIDFNGYVKSIANPLIRTYAVNPDRIKLNIRIEDISLGVDNAIPCGLIINERISNALKYAFPKDGIGEIKINLRSMSRDEIELTVSDDGIGIPEEVDIKKTESLGLQLVHILAEDQLDGTLELQRDRGTAFKIRFKN